MSKDNAEPGLLYHLKIFRIVEERGIIEDRFAHPKNAFEVNILQSLFSS